MTKKVDKETGEVLEASEKGLNFLGTVDSFKVEKSKRIKREDGSEGRQQFMKIDLRIPMDLQVSAKLSKLQAIKEKPINIGFTLVQTSVELDSGDAAVLRELTKGM